MTECLECGRAHCICARAATPQHSVTEQATFWYDDSATFAIQPLHGDAWQASIMVCNRKFGKYTTPLTQPPASTAATQPEQASDARTALQAYVDFASTRRGELGSLSPEMEAVDAQARAALAIPASTAPTQQENEPAKVCNPVWQKREGSFGETVIRCATCGTFKGRPCRLPASTAASEQQTVPESEAEAVRASLRGIPQDERINMIQGAASEKKATIVVNEAGVELAIERREDGKWAFSPTTIDGQRPHIPASTAECGICETDPVLCSRHASTAASEQQAEKGCYCGGWTAADGEEFHNVGCPEEGRASEQRARLVESLELAATWIEHITPEQLELWRDSKVAEIRRDIRNVGRATIPSEADERAKELANVITYLTANGHMKWLGVDDDEAWSSDNAEFQAILNLVRAAITHRAADQQGGTIKKGPNDGSST